MCRSRFKRTAGNCTEIAEILSDNCSLFGAGTLEDGEIKLTAKVREFDYGNYVMPACAKLVGNLPRPHLIEQEPQALNSACCRSNAANACSAS
jgi:hypothetical protein